MWKCTGNWLAAHASHTGSHARLARSGRTKVLRVGGHVDAAQVQAGDAIDLADAFVDVPDRQDGHRQKSTIGSFLQFGGRVVVNLDAQPAQHRIGDGVGQALTAEADRVGVEHLPVDAAGVHHLQADVGVESRLMDAVDAPHDHGLAEGELLFVPVDDAAAARETEH